MITLKGNYSFRFPQNIPRQVHYITPGAKAYHTVPFFGTDGQEKRVLLFWKDNVQRQEGTVVETVTYEDALFVGELMDMPVAVVLGKTGEMYDLYYIRNKRKDSKKCPKRKHFTS